MIDISNTNNGNVHSSRLQQLMFEFVGNTSTGNGHNEDLMDIDFSAPTKEFQPILPGLEQSVHSFEYTHSLIDDGRSRGGDGLAAAGTLMKL